MKSREKSADSSTLALALPSAVSPSNAQSSCRVRPPLTRVKRALGASRQGRSEHPNSSEWKRAEATQLESDAVALEKDDKDGDDADADADAESDG
jgi:hypothetical protein